MERIQEYLVGLDFQLFKWDYKTVDAVIRNFEVIGEASKNVPENIKENIQIFPGKKCTDFETESVMNILESTTKFSGILQPSIYLKITRT
jgi:hypothetical protein